MALPNPLTSTAIEARVVPMLPAHHWLMQRQCADQFNVARLFHVTDPKSTVLAALQSLILRHPALRGSLRDGKLHIANELEQRDWWFEHKVESACQLEILCEQEQQQTALAGPTFRACWINSADGASYLLLTLHHLLVDYMAEFVLWSDLKRFLKSSDPLAEDATLFDFLDALETFASDGAEDYLPHWQAMVERSFTALPSLVKTSDVEQIEGFSFVNASLSKTLTQQLAKLAQQRACTLQSVILLIVWRAFEHVFQQSTLRLALVCNGRASAVGNVNPMKTVGWLVNYCLNDIYLDRDDSLLTQLHGASKQAMLTAPLQLSYSALRFYNKTHDVSTIMHALQAYHFGFNFIPQNLATSLPYPYELAEFQPQQTDKWFNWNTPPFINVFFHNKELQIAVGHSPLFTDTRLIQRFVDQIVLQAQYCCEQINEQTK